ncbi:hypothetical protein ES703_102848 [subsurface metagenome]
MFVAVVTGVSPASHIVAVINDVLEPSAIILVVGFAAFRSFSGTPVIMVILTVPSLKPVAVEFTVAVPRVVVDCNLTVDSPDTAALVVVPTNVPSPDTLNVIVFVAVVTGLFPESDILAVINEVDKPSAAMVVGSAAFMSFVGTPCVNTFTVP